MKNLIKSYSFWTGLAGAVGLLVVSIGKIFGMQITATGVEEVIMAVCGVLVVFGIVKKPQKQDENPLAENKGITDEVKEVTVCESSVKNEDEK